VPIFTVYVNKYIKLLSNLLLVYVMECLLRMNTGTYKVRNEIETKRNETKLTKMNETKSTKTKRNETKSTKRKRNKTKPTKSTKTKRNTMLD
jgi:hypothetical protein